MNTENTSPLMSLNDGYILIPRALINGMRKLNRENRECDDLSAFIILMSKVNFADNHFEFRGERLLCQMGESLLAMEKWAKLFHWPIGRTRSFFKRMQRKGLIEVTATGKGLNRIRVIGYRLIAGNNSDRRIRRRMKRDEGCEAFIELYHRIADKPMQELPAIRREWGSLSEVDRVLAVEGIAEFCNGKNPRFIKSAANYLRDRSFLNEQRMETFVKPITQNVYEPQF